MKKILIYGNYAVPAYTTLGIERVCRVQPIDD